jgi:hypothetical protein
VPRGGEAWGAWGQRGGRAARRGRQRPGHGAHGRHTRKRRATNTEIGEDRGWLVGPATVSGGGGLNTIQIQTNSSYFKTF